MNSAPGIEKVQYNMPDTEHSFGGVSDVEQEYYLGINHDDWAVRIVLANGNWLEYRKLDDSTVEECVFVHGRHPTGPYEAFLEDSIEVDGFFAETVTQFCEGVDVSIEVYQRDIETVEDAESGWGTIVPAVTDGIEQVGGE